MDQPHRPQSRAPAASSAASCAMRAAPPEAVDGFVEAADCTTGTLMVTWRLMHVQWDIQALRGNAAITSNCSQCRSSPLPPQNSIRNEDILHTGDQVSPTSQTVAGPRATRRALNVPSALIVAPGARHRLRRPAAHSGPCVWRSCNANSASSAPSPAPASGRLRASLMLRGARSICGTESGGGRCRVIVAQTRSLRLGDQAKRVAAAGRNNSQHIPEAAAAFTCTETRGPESRRWRHAQPDGAQTASGVSQPLRAAQTASVAAQYGRVHMQLAPQTRGSRLSGCSPNSTSCGDTPAVSAAGQRLCTTFAACTARFQRHGGIPAARIGSAFS
jgi:hypothetical protein